MPSNVYGCPSAGNSARLFETGSLLKKASVLSMLAGVPAEPALRLYSGAVSYKAVLAHWTAPLLQPECGVNASTPAVRRSLPIGQSLKQPKK